jgi:hypothetical protein
MGMSLLSAEDVEVWPLPPPSDQDPETWPSILQAILWRLWDARNATIFRSERLSARNVLSKVCDDLTIWEGRFASASMVPGLRRCHAYLRSCISNQGSVSSWSVLCIWNSLWILMKSRRGISPLRSFFQKKNCRFMGSWLQPRVQYKTLYIISNLIWFICLNFQYKFSDWICDG